MKLFHKSKFYTPHFNTVFLGNQKFQFTPFTEEDEFPSFYTHFTDRFSEKLVTELGRLNQSFFDLKSLLYSLTIQYKKMLYKLARKTVIYEFHEMFDEFHREEDFFYRQFNDAFSNYSAVENILKKYPVLREMIDRTSDQFIQYSLSIIKAYIAHYEEIAETFHQQFGRLLSIKVDAGDSHCEGKSVAILICECGKIVYKPRSLEGDQLYQKIIRYFNHQYDTELKTPIMVSKSNYGFQEYIESTSCQTLDEVSNYYYELGIHLAFIYAFQGSDFHYENIICNGLHPVLIDLETLFQSTLYFTEESKKDSVLKVSSSINRTVYKSTFFTHTSYPEENHVLDVSGLTNIELHTFDKEVVVNNKTDKVAVESQESKFGRGTNLPIYKDSGIEIFGYEHAFVKGFTKAYQVIKYDKLILQMIEEHSSFPVRIIVRPTYIYAKFLSSLLHPKYLKEKEERKRILSLFQGSSEGFEAFKFLHMFEMDDMYKGDVPYFYTSFDKEQVYSSSGHEISYNLLHYCPKQEVINKISSLSTKDMEYQIQLINMALSSTEGNRERNPEFSCYHHVHTIGREISCSTLLQQETNRILERAIIHDKYIQWVSPHLSPNGKLVSGPLNFNIYDGLGGIAIYLASYAQTFSDSRVDIILPQVHSTINKLVEKSVYRRNASAYYGLPSYYYYSHYMKKTGNLSYDSIKEYEDFAEKVVRDIESYKSLDFIGGLAGLLKMLVNLYNVEKSEVVKKAAEVVKNTIVNKAITKDQHLYWEADHNRNLTLSGFSHGITGICYALSEYVTKVNHDTSLISVIQQALLYEDRFYDESQHAWKDNRENYSTHSAPLWCHGSAGILLGRGKIKDNLGNEVEVNYLEESLQNTLHSGNKHNQGYSLCHGTLGNLDILNEIRSLESFRHKEDEITSTIEKWLVDFRRDLEMYNFQNGIKNDFSGVGFMLGITGQLYALLRLKNPSLPSLLLLD